VRRRTSIRTRLALVYGLLAAAVLVAAMGAVYEIEASDTQHRLFATSHAHAQELVAVGGGERDGDGGNSLVTPPGLTEYLAVRGGPQDGLLYVSDNHQVYTNHPSARALATIHGNTTVAIGGVEYAAAVVHAANGGDRIAIAALPTSLASSELNGLLRRTLEIGAVSLVLTLILAWLAAHRALLPLVEIAERADRVSGGDLALRIGQQGTHDEIARVAEAIDAMLDRLEEAFLVQRRFVQDASHELRTPITIARGHLEVLMLTAAPSPNDVREAVTLAIRELERMGHVVSSLLRLARLDEQGLAHARPVALLALIEDAADRTRPLGDREIEIVDDIPPATSVLGDRAALDQVLLNLISNAVRHTRPGGRIEIGARIENATTVALWVRDDGDGIAQDVLPTLFDRFTRADSARMRDTGGAGLGLAICQAIVEAHGGTISADSQLGHGATFTIRLPASDRERRLIARSGSADRNRRS
jgi:two-component system, OmpR family, sensor kinase